MLNDISTKQFWLGIALLAGIIMAAIAFGTYDDGWCNYPNHEVKTDNSREHWQQVGKIGYYVTEYRYDCVNSNDIIQDVQWR